MLFSSDFRAVDEPTHMAVGLFYTMYGADPALPEFVKPAFESAKASLELGPKRALWLMLLRTLPPIAAYVSAHAKHPAKAAALGVWLDTEVELLFTGGYSAHESPLDEFVSAAQIFYNTQ
jgi:hypothetical protein